MSTKSVVKKKTLWMGGGSLRLQSWGKLGLLTGTSSTRSPRNSLSFTCNLLKYLERLIKVRMVDELSP